MTGTCKRSGGSPGGPTWTLFGGKKRSGKRGCKRGCKRGGGQSGPGLLEPFFGGRKRSGKRSCRGGGPKFHIHGGGFPVAGGFLGGRKRSCKRGGGSTNFADEPNQMYGGGTGDYSFIPGVSGGGKRSCRRGGGAHIGPGRFIDIVS